MTSQKLQLLNLTTLTTLVTDFELVAPAPLLSLAKAYSAGLTALVFAVEANQTAHD